MPFSESMLQVQEAVKRADAESKAKIEKIQEIKRLNAEIEGMRSELSKFEEQLEDCKKYKEFIDSLTPKEFFDEQEQKKNIQRTRKVSEWKVRWLRWKATLGLSGISQFDTSV